MASQPRGILLEWLANVVGILLKFSFTDEDMLRHAAPSRHGALGSWLQRKDVAKRVPEEAGRGDCFGDEAESDLNSIQPVQSPAFTTAATPLLEKCGIFRHKKF